MSATQCVSVISPKVVQPELFEMVDVWLFVCLCFYSLRPYSTSFPRGGEPHPLYVIIKSLQRRGETSTQLTIHPNELNNKGMPKRGATLRNSLKLTQVDKPYMQSSLILSRHWSLFDDDTLNVSRCRGRREGGEARGGCDIWPYLLDISSSHIGEEAVWACTLSSHTCALFLFTALYSCSLVPHPRGMDSCLGFYISAS